MQNIRTKDQELINVLETQLQEYIVKPIPQVQLENTIETLIQHIRENSRRQERIIKVSDDCKWDKQDKALYHEGKEVILTNKERELLALLFNNTNHAIAYNTICMALWGETVDTSKQERIKTLVKQLRKKLPHNVIKNIFAFGYKIEL
jgi:DNA-binding response OmpR family regulator